MPGVPGLLQLPTAAAAVPSRNRPCFSALDKSGSGAGGAAGETALIGCAAARREAEEGRLVAGSPVLIRSRPARVAGCCRQGELGREMWPPRGRGPRISEIG